MKASLKKNETHPFDAFVPDNALILILGSFPGKEFTQGKRSQEDWYYGAERNKFWTIISAVYKINIKNKEEKQNLLKIKRIAITDILSEVIRNDNNNLDSNLSIIKNNKEQIANIIEHTKINSVFCTSRFVEKEFKKMFPEMKNVEYLPSPSPRNARMKLEDKINYYRKKLAADQ